MAQMIWGRLSHHITNALAPLYYNGQHLQDPLFHHKLPQYSPLILLTLHQSPSTFRKQSLPQNHRPQSPHQPVNSVPGQLPLFHSIPHVTTIAHPQGRLRSLCQRQRVLKSRVWRPENIIILKASIQQSLTRFHLSIVLTSPRFLPSPRAASLDRTENQRKR